MVTKEAIMSLEDWSAVGLVVITTLAVYFGKWVHPTKPFIFWLLAELFGATFSGIFRG